MKEEVILNISQLSDEELIAIIDDDRNKVLAIIYERYEKLIYYKAISLLKDQHMALDLTHDIFIRIFTKLDQFKGRSKFSLWVYSITFNTCLKYLNKKKQLKLFDLEDQQEGIKDQGQDDISEKMLLEINISALQSCMEELKEEERLILIMKYTDGLTVNEISQITGLKESNIKMRLKRTREKLLKMHNALNIN